ncbi:conserved hypothetical protein [Verrucomicrobiia bacterium DG1235]|nr:conserved hypothetical protein [Verrucomicrobiae bacterium DG1235]
MTQADRQALLATPFVVLIGIGFAFAGSNGAPLAHGIHPFALSVALAFIINWLAFIPAFIWQTEKYFDLVGSLSYITVALVSFIYSGHRDPLACLLLAMVLIWAARLGTFLFKRIHKSGKDGRFDAMKPSFIRFSAAWTLQGLWVTFTAAAALAAISADFRPQLGLATILGSLIWIAGFAIEAIADLQKSRFKANPDNQGKFISSGLWSRSRHPNYFGEILLWIGVAFIAFPALQGWQYLTLLSPVFVAILLCKVSGIPLLEERADEKWGGQPDYEAYKKNTPVLLPRI